MPDPGRARPEHYLCDISSTAPDYPALPWRCDNVTMLNIHFEVRKETLLDLLPPMFNRSTPPFCRLIILDHPESPVGPFREAVLALGCRYNMFPAGFAVASLTDNPQVLAAGLLERRFPITLGTMTFDATADAAHATLADETGSLLGVEFPALQTIEPGRLAYDHVNAFRTTGHNGGARTDLVVVSPDMEIAQAAISKSARIMYPSARDTVWHALRARQVISAQIVRGTRTVAAAKPVEAMQGSTGQSAPQRSGAEITSLQQVFAGLPVIFNKETARGLTAIYQFDFTGEHAAQYYVVIENETCSAKEGTHPSPHMTLSMAGEDYLDLVNGKLNPQMAFMSGKMKISGDMSLAMKMASLFPRPA